MIISKMDLVFQRNQNDWTTSNFTIKTKLLDVFTGTGTKTFLLALFTTCLQ